MFKPENTTLQFVDELIDQENWAWHQTLVRETFLAPDAEAILNIPLRNGGGEDFQAWAFDSKGNYSVKTSYRALVTRNERLAQEEGTDTDTSQTDRYLWTSLWKLKVIPKVRVFWWRVLKKILPVEETLKMRHIKELDRCSVCLAMSEDLRHVLIHCSHAKSFWREAEQLFDFWLPRLHPETWSRDIVCDRMFSDEERAKIITVMWAIWHSRNHWVHDQEQLNPRIAVQKIREDLALLELPRQAASVLLGYRWRPPENEIVKINCDGAIDFSYGRGSAGGVAHSATRLLGSWCKPQEGVTDPPIMETLALREGVIFAKL